MSSKADSSVPNAVPCKLNITNDPTALTSDSLPTIDFSALTAADPTQRSKAVGDLGRACEEWGIFRLVNHGIPEKLMDALFSAAKEFFDSPHEEKKQYESKSATNPIHYHSFNVSAASNQTLANWRANLNIDVHPEFHCPHKPKVLRELVLDYTDRTRKLAKELLKAVSDDLGLEHEYVHEVLNMDSTFQQFGVNLYPCCPEPEKAIGLSTHTDPVLFTLVIHNGVAGLQIQRSGNWFNIDSPQYSITVNCGDQLQIFTNGRCRSLKHRATLNKEKERISIVVGNGPSREAVVGPAAPLVEKDGVAFYHSMKYAEYWKLRLTKKPLDGKSFLEQQMTQDEQIAKSKPLSLA